MRQALPPAIGSRRSLLAAVLTLLLASHVDAETDGVPLPLQAKLLSKVVKYDKNFTRRARGRVRVAVLVDARSAESKYAGSALRREIGELEDLGGLPFNVQVLELQEARHLRSSIDAEHISVLYVTPGLRARVGDIAQALAGADVLSVAVGPDDVPNGIVLGFDLVSSQPKLLCNLAAAARQNVAFEPQALKLMKVFR
jgi:hypothetical protein